MKESEIFLMVFVGLYGISIPIVLAYITHPIWRKRSPAKQKGGGDV